MKLGVCVPYRNREEHMNQFVPHVTKFLEERGIEHTIYLAHQCDDKLFNRGLMKNIAAKYAFDDGCDYIVWHDIDMVPEDESCDYSFPKDNPQHIAVRISQSDYQLKYEEYFGGAVLFSKEQVERTNGYSNDYWDWGMEDDDLFWRAYFEGMTTGDIFKEYESKKIGVFNGVNSHIEIPANRKLVECLNKNHTISFLVCAEQQPDKVPIWLIGDKEKKFIEYWRENRDYQATLAYQLLFGLPIGLLFSLPIVINFLLGRLWYKRADAVGLSQFNPAVLIIAVMVISVFIAIVNRRFRWEKLEQQYLELLSRKKAEDEANA
mgnify:CR=1 FL=1